MNCVLAIDIGTTSTKCLLVSKEGSVLHQHQNFYPTHYPQSGFAEQDPEVIFQAVLSCISSIPQSLNKSFSIICFSGAMHSLLAIDKNGEPITPLLIWADTRSVDEASELKKMGVAQQLYESTGTPVHPMSPLCKLLWMKQHQPEIILKAFRFLSIKEFVIYKLTNEFLVDYSTASATGFFDLKKKAWSELAFQFHQVPPIKFSLPVSIYDSSKEILKDWIDKLNLDSACKIIIGSSDGCAAQLGSDAMEDGFLSLTLGTSGAVRIASAKKIIGTSDIIFNYVFDESTFICGGATNNGAALLQWYSKNMDQNASTNLSEFVNQILHIPAGADGLLFLTYLLGERAPMYDADARGVFFGISVEHTKLHFQRALLEGICFALKSILISIEKATNTNHKIKVSGGITHSSALLQMLSNILGRELIVSSENDASAMGAAIIGFRAIGIEMNIDCKTQSTITPDLLVNQKYENLFKVWVGLYPSLEHSFQQLAEFRKVCHS